MILALMLALQVQTCGPNSAPPGPVSGTITVTFCAADPGTPSSGVASLVCTLDGKLFSDPSVPAVGIPPTTPPTLYTFQVDTTKLTDGQHRFDCTAKDNAGLTGATSQTFQVQNQAPDTTPPIVGITIK